MSIDMIWILKRQFQNISKKYKAERPVGRSSCWEYLSLSSILSSFFPSFPSRWWWGAAICLKLFCDAITSRSEIDPQVDTELVKFNNYRTVRTHCTHIYYESDHDDSRKWKGAGWIVFLPVSFLLSRSSIILISDLYPIPFLSFPLKVNTSHLITSHHMTWHHIKLNQIKK